ncbi:hypothetical protein [uncultured Oscillibacter sp.]|uniref:hypothetical protein n=2 Tax=uncultured Oscillibacter sp. TaxID=876091 RepID=UPI0025EC98C1|nr:hypothetical protein [uncultured Oscillibacter sp.]
MVSKTRILSQSRRVTALALAAALVWACGTTAVAAEPIGDGVAPTFDEAYYATLDYYGNLTEGSVVKSYILNGAASLTDYGTYDDVVNLTDGTLPATSGGETTFSFDGKKAPTHFYFEGKTTKPFQDLPWTLSLHYTLNGVPTKAEDLAGKTGVVEILIDIVPNDRASQYARNNYTLEAMAMFNQDDILSLEAPGAQVQLIGNLRAVLFLALPGEEQHFTIRVGAEDFSFGGMTFLMVPATLSQLEQIADLSQKKDELEDDYHRLSGSLDDLLSAMNGLTGSLNASANGLDLLNQARGTFSDGKGALYDGTGLVRGDLEDLAAQLEPVAEQVRALSQLVTDSKGTLNTMADTALELREQLADLEDALENLEDGTGDVRRLLTAAANLKGSLNSLQRALGGISGGSGGEEEETPSSRVLVKRVKAVHKAYETADLQSFMEQMLVINGTAASDSQAEALAGQLMQLVNIPADVAAELLPEQYAYWQSAQALKSLRDYAQSGATFQQFCEQLPGVTKSQAKQMNDLWIVYSSGKLEEDSGTQEETRTLYAAMVRNDPAEDGSSSGSNGASGNGGTAGDGSSTGDGDPTGDSGSSGSGGEESGTVGGAAIDLITDGLDSTVSTINSIKKELTGAMEAVAKPTAALVGDLADLCGRLDDITDLMEDAEDMTKALRRASHKIRSLLTEADGLRDLLNDYEPTLQETLSTVSGLSVTASAAVADTASLIGTAEDLLRRTGSQLDDGTRQTLESLATVLRRTANVMATSGSIQSSKNAMTDIIEDLWNDHTGDVDNLLMMDATAKAESLTDARNGSPQSIQVLIRSQEIKVEEPEEPETEKKAGDNGTFWSRVGQMFRDFWAAITGIFH